MGGDWGAKVHLHASAAYLRAHDPERFDASYSYAFVRNPWDRMVSLYHYRGAPGPFPDWVARCAEVNKGAVRLSPSCWSMVSEEDERLVNFVGRYETLASDFADLREDLGLPPKRLPHQNAGALRCGYRTYYCADTRDFIGEHYADDVELFGYDF